MGLAAPTTSFTWGVQLRHGGAGRTRRCACCVDIGARQAVHRGVRTARGGAAGHDQDWTADLHAAVVRMKRMRPPVVAAIHGHVAGGSVSLMAAADLVVIGKSARITSAFTRIGFSPDTGSTITLKARMARRAQSASFCSPRYWMPVRHSRPVWLIWWSMMIRSSRERSVSAWSRLAVRQSPVAGSRGCSCRCRTARSNANWRTRRKRLLPSPGRPMRGKESRPFAKGEARVSRGDSVKWVCSRLRR